MKMNFEEALKNGATYDDLLKQLQEAQAQHLINQKKNDELRRAAETVADGLNGFFKIMFPDFEVAPMTGEECIALAEELAEEMKPERSQRTKIVKNFDNIGDAEAFIADFLKSHNW